MEALLFFGALVGAYALWHLVMGMAIEAAKNRNERAYQAGKEHAKREARK